MKATMEHVKTEIKKKPDAPDRRRDRKSTSSSSDLAERSGTRTEEKEPLDGLDLAIRGVILTLRYLYLARERAGREYVPVSRISMDINIPYPLVARVVLRLNDAGCMYVRNGNTLEAGFDSGVRERSLAELALAVFAPDGATPEARLAAGYLEHVPAEDILPVATTNVEAPALVRAAAAGVLGIAFCLSYFGLYRVPAAFAGTGAIMLLASSALHWLGRKANLRVLPQCVLESVMAGSLLWVGFGLVHLLW